MNFHESFEMNTAEAETLLQRYFEGELAPSDAERLVVYCNTHSDFKRYAQDNFSIDYLFRFLDDAERNPISYEGSQADPIVLDVASSKFAEEKNASFRCDAPDFDFESLVLWETNAPKLDVSVIASESEQKPQEKNMLAASKEKRHKPPLFTIPAPILVLLLLAFFVWAIYSEFFIDSSQQVANSGFRPLVRVEAVLDVRWENEEEAFKEGQQLGIDAVRFREGIVQLVFPSGVRVAVKGPADFRLNNRKKMFLGEGRLSATVPPTGKGFEVATPFLNVIDLGTEFFLDVKKDQVEAHTIRGKIAINGIDEKKTELIGGEALRFDTAGKISRFAAEANPFLTDLFVLGMRKMRDEKLLDQWTLQRLNLLQMPGLCLFYDFEDGDDRIVNHVRPSEIGRLLGANRCEGRWYRKKACSFYRKNDAIETALSRNMNSATLWVSFRLDSFSQFNHVLLGSRGTDAGNFVWQIFGDGSIQLAVRPQKDAYPVLYRTASVFPENRCGAWYQLATVVDASKKEIRTYLDGKLLDVSPMTSEVPLNLGEATLGNWLPTKRTATASNLNGRIDQFMIFDRVLTNEEIRQLSLTDSQPEMENEP